MHRPESKWYNESIRAAKQDRRKAERRWRKSKLQVHRDAFVEHRDRVNTMIDAAKRAYYRDMISGCKNTKQLFGAVNKLLGRQVPKAFPSNIPPSHLAEMFNEFFVEKITKIRESIQPCNDPTPISPPTHCTMTSFQPVTNDYVAKLITSAANKSCDLDPIPTELVK